MNSAPDRLIEPGLGFWEEEEGSITILSLFLILITLVIGGLSIDFNRVMADRTRLQVAADAAAHAALYAREDKSASEAKQVAKQIVGGVLPTSGFKSTTLTTSDVTFGNWDAKELKFTANASSKSAVRVVANMTETRDNASRNLLLHIIGFDTFDVGVKSIYSTYYPPCFTEGFVAEEVVDIQSNNHFAAPFCVHSNEYVSLNQNNVFEPGTVVSMPDLDDLDIANSGFEKNQGLKAALRTSAYRPRLLSDLPEIIDSFWSAQGKHLPPYVSPGFLYEVDEDRLAVEPEGDAETSGNGKGSNKGGSKKSGSGLTPYHFEPNSVNYMNCWSSGSTTLGAGTYSDFVFVADCEITFAQGVVLEDVVIATTDTGARSLNTPSGLTIGRDDSCATGGGAVLMTLGGFHAAAKLNVFGGQILALGDIEFAANADGIKGASFVSGGSIDGTSNMNMGSCNKAGMEHIYQAQYFRMVD